MSTSCPFQRALEPANRPDPYPLYAQVSRTPSCLDDGRYVVTGYSDVLALLHDPRLTSAGETGGEAGGDAPHRPARVDLLRLDPPDHDRIRRIMMRHFGPPNQPYLISGLEGEITKTANDLIDAFPAGAAVDVVESFAHPLPLAIIRKIMDIPKEDEGRFREWVEAVTGGTGETKPSDEAADAFKKLSGYLAEMADSRRGGSGRDFLSGLVNDDGPEGRLPEKIIGPMSALFLIAGHETTVNLIANGILTLLRHPEQRLRLRQSPERAVRIVEELLRFEPPVQFMQSRMTLADVEVGGVTIPAGRNVVLLLAAANRDPERFERPEDFDPDRPDNQHLGFGSGVHSCFGAPLARLEGQVALRAFFDRLDNPKLSEAPPYRISPLLRGPSKLCVAYDAVRAQDP